MSRNPIATKALLALVVAGLALPMMICLILALASLLHAMGDADGSAVLRYVALAGGVVWIVVLLGLIFVQAINTIGRSNDGDR